MSYLVLARKYRPQTFADVIGQEHITQTLANAIEAGRLSHAILLSGPRGTGKTTMARLLAKSMNCEHGPTVTPCNQCENCKAITAGYSADVLEIDGASNNGVDQVRELRENSKYMPAQSRYKIYIIDEVHMLSIAAFNALLKTLEEPPAHVLFFFATTERHKLPVTILSRCQRYDFRRVQLADVSAHLGKLCQSEGIEIDPACLDMIARECGGSVRDAVSLLDQVISTAKGPVNMPHAMLALGITERRNILDLAHALLTKNAADVLELIAAIYDSGYDLKKLHQDLLEHFRDLLLVKLQQNADLVTGDLQVLRDQALLADVTALNYYLDALFRAESTIKYASNSRLALETVLLRLLAAPPALSVDTLIHKLDDLCQQGVAMTGYAATEKKTPAAELKAQVVVEDKLHSPALVLPATPADVASVPSSTFTGDENCLPAILNYLEQNNFNFTLAIMKMVRVQVNGDKVVINTGSHTAVNRLKTDKYMQALTKAFKDVLGRPMEFEFECTATTDSVGLQEVRNQRKVREQALAAHPLINDALNIFRGTVAGIKIVDKTNE